jgi:hypothetical protein
LLLCLLAKIKCTETVKIMETFMKKEWAAQSCVDLSVAFREVVVMRRCLRASSIVL